MRSIERRYLNLQQTRPLHSSYLNFAAAIRGQKFSTNTIHRWFNKLVDKDDYASKEKRVIVRELVALSNTFEDNVKQAQNASLPLEKVAT